MMTPRAKLAWVVGPFASCLTCLSLTIAMWSQVGWTTPAKHDADIASIIAERMVSEQNVINAIKESRDEWKCDEYDEELLDLLREQEETDTVEIRREIEKIKDKMEKLDCQRFEDFG